MPGLILDQCHQEVEAAVEDGVVGARAQNVADDNAHEAHLAGGLDRIQMIVAKVEQESGQDDGKSLAGIFVGNSFAVLGDEEVCGGSRPGLV